MTKILVADDEPAVRRLVGSILAEAQAGWKVFEAGDGREALREIKSDPDLRKIPVVVLTTSKAEEDVARSYLDGANSFITKPSSFEGLVGVVQSLGKYWLDTVDLPGGRDAPAP